MLVREHAAMGTPDVYDDGMSTFFENVRDDGSATSFGLKMGRASAAPPTKKAGRPLTFAADRGQDFGGLFLSAPLGALRARAVLVDMEEGVVNQVLRSPIGDLFDRSSQLITDVSGAGNNWAAGFHGYGPVYGGAVMEKVRRALEACDSPQSFLLLHSTGGGTGSGLGSRILATLADEFPEMYRFATSVFPSEDDDVVTSPYNFALSFNQLAAHADCVLPLENQALLDVSAAVEAGLRKLARGPGGGGSALASASAVASARQSSLIFVPPPPMRASRLLFDSRPMAPLWSASSSRSVAGSLAGSRATAAPGDAASVGRRGADLASNSSGGGIAPLPRKQAAASVLLSSSASSLPGASSAATAQRPGTGPGNDSHRSGGRPDSSGATRSSDSLTATPLKGGAVKDRGIDRGADRLGTATSAAAVSSRSSPAADRATAAAGAAAAPTAASRSRGRMGTPFADAARDGDSDAGATPSRASRAASAGAVPRSRNLGHVAVGILPGMATKPMRPRATRSKPPTSSASLHSSGRGGGARGGGRTGSRIFHDDADDYDYRGAAYDTYSADNADDIDDHHGHVDEPEHGGLGADSFAGEADLPEAAPVLSSLAAADAAIARALAIAAANAADSESKEADESRPAQGGSPKPAARTGSGAGTAAARSRVTSSRGAASAASASASASATGSGSGASAGAGRPAAVSAAASSSRAGAAALAGPRSSRPGTTSAESAASAALRGRGAVAAGLPPRGGVTGSAAASGARPATGAGRGGVTAASTAGGKPTASLPNGGRDAMAREARSTALRPTEAASTSSTGLASASARAPGSSGAAVRASSAPEQRPLMVAESPFARVVERPGKVADYGDVDDGDDHHDDDDRDRLSGYDHPDGGGAYSGSSWPAYTAGDSSAAAEDHRDDESFEGDDADGGGGIGSVKRGRKGTAFDSMNNLAAHLVGRYTVPFDVPS